jgi:hypothetical protein
VRGLSPFSLPPGVFDEKRLLSDEDYELLLKQGRLERNIIDPLFRGEKK